MNLEEQKERIKELEDFVEKMCYYFYREREENELGPAMKLLYSYKDIGDLQEYNAEFFRTIDIMGERANRLRRGKDDV